MTHHTRILPCHRSSPRAHRPHRPGAASGAIPSVAQKPWSTVNVLKNLWGSWCF